MSNYASRFAIRDITHYYKYLSFSDILISHYFAIFLRRNGEICLGVPICLRIIVPIISCNAARQKKTRVGDQLCKFNPFSIMVTEVMCPALISYRDL